MPTGESLYGGGLGGGSRHRPRRAPPVAGPGVNPQASAPQPTHYPSPAPQVSGSSGYPGTPASHSAPAPTPSHVSPTTHPILSSLSPAELALGAYAIAAAKTYGLTPEALIGVNHLANATAPEKATLRDIAGSAREVPPAATIRQQTLPIRASGKQLATPDTARQFTGAPPRQGTLAALAAKGQGIPGRAAVDAREFAKNPAQTARTVAAQRVANQLGGSLTNKGARQKLRKAASGGPQNVLNVAGAVAPKRTKKALGGLLFATTGNTPQGKTQQAAQKKGQPKHPKVPIPTGGALSPSQRVFAASLASHSGLDPRFVASWMVAEEPAGKSTNPATGNQNWLNIGYPGHITAGAQNPIFNNPVSAGKASAAWMSGQLDLPGWGTASPSIQGAYRAATATKNPAAQAQAFGASDWGTSAATIGASIGSFGVAKGRIPGLHVSGDTRGLVTVHGNSPYVFPFAKGAYTRSRTDQGVDFTGTGPIRAMGNARIIDVNGMGWPNGGEGPSGQNVAYRLLDGPHAGRAIFVAEGITPHVRPKQVVKKGDVIASFYPGSSIETGWYAPGLHNAKASPHYTEGDVTNQGQNFLGFLTNGKLGTATGGVGAAGVGGTSISGTTGGTGAAPSGVPGVAGTIAAPGRRAAAQARARVGFTLPFSPTQATSPLPYGFGGDLTGAAPSGSRGSFRPRRRLSTSR